MLNVVICKQPDGPQILEFAFVIQPLGALERIPLVQVVNRQGHCAYRIVFIVILLMHKQLTGHCWELLLRLLAT